MEEEEGEGEEEGGGGGGEAWGGGGAGELLSKALMLVGTRDLFLGAWILNLSLLLSALFVVGGGVCVGIIVIVWGL